jgi:hypothetical protein
MLGEVSRMPNAAGGPRSARMSWDEVHHLELVLRARAASIATPPGGNTRCPICTIPLGTERVRLAGALVHPDCLARAPDLP